MTTTALIPNPLLDFAGLPRFADFSPSLITPAIEELLLQARETVQTVSRADTPATLGRLRRAAGGRDRAPVARLGHGGAPERRGRHARAARRLQREPAQGHRSSGPSSDRTGRCTRSTRRCGARRVRAARRPRAGAWSSSRCSRLPAGRRGARCRRSANASWRCRERQAALGAEVLRERAGRDRRLGADRRATKPARRPCRTTCVHAAREGAAPATGKTGCEFTLHMPSLPRR